MYLAVMILRKFSNILFRRPFDCLGRGGALRLGFEMADGEIYFVISKILSCYQLFCYRHFHDKILLLPLICSSILTLTVFQYSISNSNSQ